MKKLTWGEYHDYIDQLASQIKEKSQSCMYKHLLAIEIDDSMMAAHLSHKLNVPAITDISLLIYLLNMGISEEDTLLVSNIVKTGNTFNSIMKQCGCSLDTAVLFKDSNCTFIPTYCVHVPLKFIVFPWEDANKIQREG